MATNEIVINEYLSAELRKKYPGWRQADIISCENNQTIVGSPGQRPDIIVRDNPVSPVSIETEFAPASTVEADALARLGRGFVPTGGTISAAVAVRLPLKYKTLSGQAIADELAAEQDLQYCLITGDQQTHSRWPASGFISGSVADLAYVVATARVPRATIEAGADILEAGARSLAAMLATTAASNPKLAHAVSSCLKQDATRQTFAMAATMIVNALVFQDTISGISDELEEVPSIYDAGWDAPSKSMAWGMGSDPQDQLLANLRCSQVARSGSSG